MLITMMVSSVHEVKSGIEELFFLIDCTVLSSHSRKVDTVLVSYLSGLWQTSGITFPSLLCDMNV